MARSVIKSGRGPEGITVPIPSSKKQRIIDDLIDAVRSGRLAPGHPIPSTRDLRATYDASITPVRNAIENLKARGLLVGHAGLRIYVSDPLPQWIIELME
jgi:DNA-binding GntR family transcriptional regulator